MVHACVRASCRSTDLAAIFQGPIISARAAGDGLVGWADQEEEDAYKMSNVEAAKVSE
jgi:hypothetical protein